MEKASAGAHVKALAKSLCQGRGALHTSCMTTLCLVLSADMILTATSWPLHSP